MAGYHPGDRVHVASFGKGIVREVRNHGRYLVDVKGRAMDVADTQLSPLEHERKARPKREEWVDTASSSAEERRVVTLDLHGHTVEEALEALDTCLNDALLDSASEVRVIHGKSGAKIKIAVHQRLGELASVQHYRLDPRNAGVTIVLL